MDKNDMQLKRIELGDNWFIDIDSVGNHTLKEEYVGKDKEGNYKVNNRTHGYFSNVSSAINQLFKKKSFSLMKNKQGIHELNEIYKSVRKECNALLRKFDI